MIAVLLLELKVALVWRLRQAEVHLLILVLVHNFVPLSFIVVFLVILELSEGVDRVFRKDFLTSLVQALEKEVNLN